MLLALLCLSVAVAVDTEQRLNMFNAALASLCKSVETLERGLSGAVLLYTDRTTCPEGFAPATQLDGRLPVVGHAEVGRVSAHSLHDNEPYTLEATCERMISVSEDGFINVCQHSSKQMAATINMKDAVPTFSVLACVRSP